MHGSRTKRHVGMEDSWIVEPPVRGHIQEPDQKGSISQRVRHLKQGQLLAVGREPGKARICPAGVGFAQHGPRSRVPEANHGPTGGDPGHRCQGLPIRRASKRLKSSVQGEAHGLRSGPLFGRRLARSLEADQQGDRAGQESERAGSRMPRHGYGSLFREDYNPRIELQQRSLQSQELRTTDDASE